MAGKQVSREYIRRYERPRDGGGRFTPGTTLYVRWDGEPRWLRHSFAPVDPEVERFVWLSEETRRVAMHLFVIAVAAFLAWFFW